MRSSEAGQALISIGEQKIKEKNRLDSRADDCLRRWEMVCCYLYQSIGHMSEVALNERQC